MVSPRAPTMMVGEGVPADVSFCMEFVKKIYAYATMFDMHKLVKTRTYERKYLTHRSLVL
jgi:hypothetical protein